MSLAKDGFTVHPSVVDEGSLQVLRESLSTLAVASGAGLRNLAQKSKPVAKLASSPQIQALLPERKMHLVRSLFFDKTAQANWPVAWHQDRTIAVKERIETEGFGPWSTKDHIIHVEPPAKILERIITLRLHLDPTGADNGALQVIPGSHLAGKVAPESISELTANHSQTIECRPGDVLAMRPLLLHSSRRSANPRHRRVIHLEFAPINCLPPQLEWHSRV